jgi:hypothetical protein
MLTDVAKLFPFKDAVRGEDLEWTIRMARSGFLVKEYRSDKDRIHYNYVMGNGRRVDHASLEYQKKTTYEEMLKSVWIPGGEKQPTGGDGTPRLRLGRNGFISV